MSDLGFFGSATAASSSSEGDSDNEIMTIAGAAAQQAAAAAAAAAAVAHERELSMAEKAVQEIAPPNGMFRSKSTSFVFAYQQVHPCNVLRSMYFAHKNGTFSFLPLRLFSWQQN